MSLKLGISPREESRLGVFGNRVLRSKFGPKVEKLTVGTIKIAYYKTAQFVLARYH
jgi:hypothetical protein